VTIEIVNRGWTALRVRNEKVAGSNPVGSTKTIALVFLNPSFLAAFS